MGKVLMKGNEAIGSAAIRAGCRYFFGYPITPQNEVPEYMSRHLPEVGGVFVQAESEIAAINMVYGAAGAGGRVMTSSSSPGIALKQEGISYLAGARLPCVIVNVMRGGPGLGGIQPAQSDYFQATRGGGNGDYRIIVEAPSTLQEAVDLMQESFDLADRYRIPVMLLCDGMIGQMMEPVELREADRRPPVEKPWATVGTGGKRKPNIITSLYLNPAELEELNLLLAAQYREITERETRVESIGLEGARVVVAAYGTTARIVREAVDLCTAKGIPVGLIRPITLWPYPYAEFDKIGKDCLGVLCVEMSMGQMLDDVKIAANGRWPVHFYGRTGGVVPDPRDIAREIEVIAGRRPV
ncbi:3-methyl-2-oxobutanoate dehydrogenase subunit VorB [Papillibacter cinnamivorans]|uniref:2-oxoglutarate ferredoxin oxidoreductase subunit alpha n=1 Tax=Papillibacter cinnamivorans DSM 12816 TaxID=1122930 RepID=A0A1W2CRF8_9FIRM|nr:3-methyl-2-oxobutanoate dehydrogenase subunit VorB [Papillibacter cinnamivorans]SMC87556.1 2-oxoglutarate ferredoxin oxidoreductase subunit alpha [Papillibacter cinnamivorans DSM 12816]